MRARILVIGMGVALAASPVVGARRGADWQREERVLRARVQAQRLLIRQLERQIAALARVPAPPLPPSPADAPPSVTPPPAAPAVSEDAPPPVATTLQPEADAHNRVDRYGLRVGLTAQELQAARGAPDFVTRGANGYELWGYGYLRITVLNGRIAGWQRVALPASIPSQPSSPPTIGEAVLPPPPDPVPAVPGPDDTPLPPP